ncbi:MAG: phosphoglycerate kinase [Bacteroidales bacterium]|nr:phosphoglycerate kinase [Bacteroidales bacterium]MCF8387061.1 phosphoglycerate kinase [Bacteroidales bacterium]MCF8397759.1 phosphoglycerate kinase [Bacteroidales bacterium]
MKSIDNYNFEGKKAIIRVDFNVPLNDEYKITDSTRIDAAIPTIKKILEKGGAVILMSHLGRPKSGPEEKFSLKHVIPYLSEQLGQEVKFASDCIGEEAESMTSALQNGEVLLLENLRFHKEEKGGDEAFAKKLAGLADVYVNDAFGTAHRAHASTAVIARFFPEEKLFGYIMENEIKNMDKVLEDPRKPFTAILGGAKVSGKVEVIENLIDKVDNLIIGGGMMFTFIKALGGNVGKSLVEEDLIDLANEVIAKAREKDVTLYLPKDTIAASEFDNDAERKQTPSHNIPEGWMGLDIGEEAIKTFSEVIRDSKTILWNGPMGVFEKPNFAKGTKAIAEAIADATEKGAYSLVGGGDSVAAIKQMGLADKISYVSTGGGAMLEYIEGKQLPGVEAIRG